MNMHAGLPHCTTADDVFDGYFIPRGSIVMTNAWAITHNSDVYEAPDDFRPERFLRTGAQGQLELNPDRFDPAAVVFGYGRRCVASSRDTRPPDQALVRSICPGMNIARDMLFAAISSMLATLNITPASEEHGAPKLSTLEYTTSGTIYQVLPFDCSIKPRSTEAAALIAQAAKDADHNMSM
jgi:hypothetical protein